MFSFRGRQLLEVTLGVPVTETAVVGARWGWVRLQAPWGQRKIARAKGAVTHTLPQIVGSPHIPPHCTPRCTLMKPLFANFSDQLFLLQKGIEVGSGV